MKNVFVLCCSVDSTQDGFALLVTANAKEEVETLDRALNLVKVSSNKKGFIHINCMLYLTLKDERNIYYTYCAYQNKIS